MGRSDSNRQPSAKHTDRASLLSRDYQERVKDQPCNQKAWEKGRFRNNILCCEDSKRLERENIKSRQNQTFRDATNAVKWSPFRTLQRITIFRFRIYKNWLKNIRKQKQKNGEKQLFLFVFHAETLIHMLQESRSSLLSWEFWRLKWERTYLPSYGRILLVFLWWTEHLLFRICCSGVMPRQLIHFCWISYFTGMKI